jgi:hypothetical protein
LPCFIQMAPVPNTKEIFRLGTMVSG